MILEKLCISIMSVHVFRRSLIGAKEVHKGPPGIGFTLTKNGDFDIETKRFCNVASAVEPTDAVNLTNLRKVESDLRNELKKLHETINQFQKLQGAIDNLQESIDHLKKK